MNLGSNEVLRRNSVVQARVLPASANSNVIEPSTDMEARIRLFAIIAIGEPKSVNQDDVTWALTAQVSVTDDQKCIVKKPVQDHMAWLKLTAAVRKVGLYHHCGAEGDEILGRCVIHSTTGRAVHTGGILEGAIMIFQSRKQGFPPRMG